MALSPRTVALSLVLGAIDCTPRRAPVAPPVSPPVATNTSATTPASAPEPVVDDVAREQKGLPAAVAEAEALCDLGHGERCVRLGLAYSNPPTDDLPRAAARFSRGCELGEASGCLELGEALLAGHGVAINRTDAIARIGQACEMGLASACSHKVIPRVTPEDVIQTAEHDCTPSRTKRPYPQILREPSRTCSGPATAASSTAASRSPSDASMGSPAWAQTASK